MAKKGGLPEKFILCWLAQSPDSREAAEGSLVDKVVTARDGGEVIYSD